MDSEVVYIESSPLDPTTLSTPRPPAPHGGGDFFLKFEITDAYEREYTNVHSETYRCSNTKYEWQIQKDAIIQQEVSLRFTLLDILCAMNLPKAAKSSMVDKILAGALDMATRTHTTEKVFAMFVEVVCTICLENFAVDLEAIRMPCLHMFHQNCIVGWLQKTNSCPLCRFTMPTTEFGC